MNCISNYSVLGPELLSGVGYNGSMNRRTDVRAGYTLVEMAIVLALLGILSAIIVNTHGMGNDQLIIIRERASLLNLFYRGKAMSLQRLFVKGGTPGQPQDVCAFGIVFDPGVADGSFLFGDVAKQPTDSCKQAGLYQGSIDFDNKDYLFTGPDDTYTPDQRTLVTIKDGTDTVIPDFTVVFIPPDPTATTTAGVLLPISVTVSLRSNPAIFSTIKITETGLIEEL